VVTQVPAVELFLILQLVRQPVETFVKAVAARGARCLDVPIALTQRMQSEFVCDLGSIHRVRQILYTSKNTADPYRNVGHFETSSHYKTQNVYSNVFGAGMGPQSL